LGWKKGYFLKVGDVLQNGRLKHHCFRDFNGNYLDETGRKLKFRTDPCGVWGLVSYRCIDDHISDALGIPRVPVED